MTAPGEHEFTVVGSTDVHIGRVVGLRVDDVAMPGGGTAKREIVEHLGAVAVVAVDERQRVTMIHQYRHPFRRRLLELPAGLLDVAGEDPVVTARRELVEEAGLTAARWHTLVDVAGSAGFTDEVVRVFLARELTEAGRPVPDDDDEELDIVLHRVPLAAAVRRVLSGELINGATVSGILAADAVLNHGADARPADAPWRDKPQAFAARKNGPRR
ncbi:MAG: NUDIX domain-containing protein [Thermocrispum sp.]